MPANRASHAGYSLVELTVVIVLVGILSVYVAPRLGGRGDLSSQLFLDEMSAALGYARLSAIASGCDVEFSLTATGYAVRRPATLCDTTSFTVMLVDPAGDDVSGTLPAGAALGGTVPQTIRYRPDGSTNVATDLSYTAGGRTLTIHANSGITSIL